MLVLTFGDGVYGFTLERQTGDFVLTDSGLKTPSRGKNLFALILPRSHTFCSPLTQCEFAGHAYSAGDSVQGDWPEWLKHYVMTISHGDGQTSSPYSARCTGSLIADFHRTLM